MLACIEYRVGFFYLSISVILIDTRGQKRETENIMRTEKENIKNDSIQKLLEQPVPGVDLPLCSKAYAYIPSLGALHIDSNPRKPSVDRAGHGRRELEPTEAVRRTVQVQTLNPRRSFSLLLQRLPGKVVIRIDTYTDTFFVYIIQCENAFITGEFLFSMLCPDLEF